MDRFSYVPEPIIRSDACHEVFCTGAATARFVYEHRAVDATLPVTDVSSITRSASLLRLHVGVAWAPLSWLQWSADIPVLLYQGSLLEVPNGGLSPNNVTRVGQAPDVGDIGDVRVGVRIAAACKEANLKNGLQLSFSAPTGDHEHLAGDQLGRADLTGMVEWGDHDTSWVVIDGAFGYELRHHVTLGDQQLGSSTNFGLAVSSHVCEPIHCNMGRYIELHAEGRVDGGLGLTTPAAFLGALGAQLDLARDASRPGEADVPQAPRLWITALVTAGFGHAVGVPDWGGTLGLTWAPAAPETVHKKTTQAR